jgi:hypothetical protein
MRYQLYTYDVWGNEKDGYEVNNIFSTNAIYELDENMTDKEIVKALKDQGLIKKGIHTSSIEIDGEMDYTLYFDDVKGGHCKPDFELRKID